ncbi:MAG TPA: hypothetical protein VF574_01420 [Allosphingosinicella sp.]
MPLHPIGRTLAAAAFLAAAGSASAHRPANRSSTASPAPITLALGKRGNVGGFAVTPLRIVEDSRCPASVQCVWAGTVRLAVRIAGGAPGAPILTLRQPARLDSASWLTLCAVSPYPARPGGIRPTAYRFTFVLSRGAAPSAPACPKPALASGG